MNGDLMFSSKNVVDAQGLVEIGEAISLVDYERKDVCRHQTLYKLAQENKVNTIKHLVRYFWTDYIDDAEKWLHQATDVNSDRAAETAYDFLNKILSEQLEIPVKINDILFYGLDSCGWRLCFTHKRHNFILDVPDIPNLNVETVDKVYDGQLAIGCYSNNRIQILKTSYCLKSFALVIDDMVNGKDV